MQDSPHKYKSSNGGSPTSKSQAFDKKDFSAHLALNPVSKEDLQTIKIEQDSRTVSLHSQVMYAPFTISGNGNIQSLKVEIAGLNLDLPKAPYNPNETINTLLDSAIKENTYR
jgi:hypothetical protein